MRLTYLCPLRWADLDALGHVNNVVYVDYLQEARVELLRVLRPGSGAGSPAHGDLDEAALVVRHEIDYRAPLRLAGGPLHMECWVTEVRAASFTIAYELFRPAAEDGGERTVYARATTLLTPFVFATGRPRRLDAPERERLGAFLEPQELEPQERARPARLPAVEPDRATHYDVRVRFSDVDVYRHVNNVKYVEYLQEARIAIGDALWRDPAMESLGVVVAQTEVDYHVPMVLRPEPYAVLTTVSRVGSRSLDLNSEVRDGGVLCARGRVTLVFFDRRTQRAADPSPALRERLATALDAGRP